jgi:hypothetical protein
MDVRDIHGDGATVVKLFHPNVATRISFTLQGTGLLAFAATASSALQITATIIALALLIYIVLSWKSGSQAFLLQLMKIQMLCAVTFLF